MHLTRRDLYKLSLVGAAPVALAACGGQSNLEGGDGDGGKPTITAYNGASGGLTKNFNPFSPNIVHMIQGAVYETLFYFNPIKALDQEPVKVLGESYEASEDGKQLTVTVRTGVNWTDGKPFTAKDVAYTFNLVQKTPELNTSGKSPTAEAPDDTTVVLTYPEPAFPEFANALGRTYIVPEHLFSSISDPVTDINEKPVGTGPFTLAEFTPESYLLKANEKYWQEGKPAIGGVRVLSLSGNQAATDKWLAGEIDFMSAVVPDLQKLVDSHKDLAFTNHGTAQPCLFTASNPELGCTGPQTDPAVRRALYLAMDREQLNQLAFMGLGKPVSPSCALIDRDAAFIDPAIEPAPQKADVAGAQAALEGAGWAKGSDGIYAKGGERLSLTAKVPSGWADYVTALDTLTQQYKAAGIELVPQQVSVNEWNDAKAKGDYQLVIDALAQGPAPDPYYVYNQFFSTANTVPVGENGNPYQNASRYSNPDVDAAIAAAAATDDVEEKKTHYFAIQQRIAEDLPYVPIILGSGLTEFNTSRATGWPTDDNLYAWPMSWSSPDSSQILLNIKPA